MAYLKYIHPAIFEKYGKNIKRPDADWNMVSINDNETLPPTARMMLTRIITEYYTSHQNR